MRLSNGRGSGGMLSKLAAASMPIIRANAGILIERHLLPAAIGTI